jgi:hypothetical protein
MNLDGNHYMDVLYINNYNWLDETKNHLLILELGCWSGKGKKNENIRSRGLCQ